MKILLDNNITQHFGSSIVGHMVVHARTMGWGALSNGDLIRQAEQNGFELLITADRGMEYQQNIQKRQIAIILIKSKRITLPHLLSSLDALTEALTTIKAGEFKAISAPGPAQP